MDWLQFFASVLQSIVSLAWPAALVTVAWFFRDELREVLRLRPTRIKGFGFEGEFERSLQVAEALVEQPPVPAPPPLSVPEEHTTTSPEAPGEREPESAASGQPLPPARIRILVAFRNLEARLKSDYRALIKDDASKATGDLIKIGTALGLTLTEIGALRELSLLRDLASSAGGGRVTEDEATRFEKVARAIRASLVEKRYPELAASSAGQP